VCSAARTLAGLPIRGVREEEAVATGALEDEEGKRIAPRLRAFRWNTIDGIWQLVFGEGILMGYVLLWT
jgi:hypothetical protein